MRAVKLRLLRHWDEGGKSRAAPALSGEFLACLLGELPLCRHLTHLACSHPWDADQTGLIRSFAVEPACADVRLWMHGRPSNCYRPDAVLATP